jgi:hypothetical protein
MSVLFTNCILLRYYSSLYIVSNFLGISCCFCLFHRYTKQARYQPSGGSGGGTGGAAKSNAQPSMFGSNAVGGGVGAGGHSNYGGGGGSQSNYGGGGGLGGNSISSNSNYHQASNSDGAGGTAASTQFGGSRLGAQTDISKQSRFSRLAQFGMGGGGGGAGAEPAAAAAPLAGRHGGVQPLSSGYNTNNATSITGAAAYGRHKA